jgi:two-component system, OmpR family, alkaline phosphatase synthesis response regulator PhoP
VIATIGFIEDDHTIRRHVAKRLGSLGYLVSCFESADAAWIEFENNPSSLYIVDRMVPGKLSGIDFCAKVRAQSLDMPILILSALSEASNRIEGLRAGADDYLTKPFEMEELCLRVEALLKRAGRTEPSAPGRFSWDGKTVDFERLELQAEGAIHPLAPKECQLLKLLIEREGRVVTRDEILDSLWGYQLFPSSRTVDNFIVRLRRLLEKDPSHPKYIQSVRGMGYKFTLQ